MTTLATMLSAAQRLLSYYNGDEKTAQNPGGLTGVGGMADNWDPCIQDIGTVANGVGTAMTAASASEGNAAASATAAAGSATAANASKLAAATSEGNAAGSATAAAGSASAASGSATAANASKLAAATSEGNAAASATTATQQAGIATARAGDAAASATVAGQQAGIATTKAGEAAGSASTATQKAQVAIDKAAEAAASAAAAQTWNPANYVPKTGGAYAGAVGVPPGTAAAPGLAVAGDSNTGIAQVGGADTISLVAGGTEALRGSAGGNVAVTGTLSVGSLTSSYRIDVAGTDPTICLKETDAGTDAKYWDWLPINGALTCRLVNDAYTASYAWLTVSRVGATSARVAFGAPATGKQAAVPFASTIVLDFTAAQDFVIGDLTGPLTLPNPAAFPLGQSGEIYVHQDGTGGRTVSHGNAWIKMGSGVVSPAAGKWSIICYSIKVAGCVHYSIVGGA